MLDEETAIQQRLESCMLPIHIPMLLWREESKDEWDMNKNNELTNKQITHWGLTSKKARIVLCWK